MKKWYRIYRTHLFFFWCFLTKNTKLLEAVNLIIFVIVKDITYPNIKHKIIKRSWKNVNGFILYKENVKGVEIYYMLSL